MKPVTRFFKWVRGYFYGARLPRPARFVPIDLERLEERCVTAVLSGMDATALSIPSFDTSGLESQPFLSSSVTNEITRPIQRDFPFSVPGDPAGQSRLPRFPRGSSTFDLDDNPFHDGDSLSGRIWQAPDN